MVTRRKTTVSTDTKRITEYELVFIIKPDLAEEALESAVSFVSQFITGKDGEVAEIQRWGKKKLAYPLNHFMEGYYVLARFKMNPVWSKELESALLISDDILRHMLVRLDE